MDDQQMLKAVVQELAAESRRGREPHLEPHEVLSYQAGMLPDIDRERVQEHLALCSDCARTLLDLAAFPAVEPPQETNRLSPGDLAAEWQRFREGIDSSPLARRRASWFPTAPVHLPYALAAALLIAVVGLSLWVGRLNQQIADLSGPRFNLGVADLMPRERAAERGMEGEEVVHVTPSMERLVLILGFAEARPVPNYRVEIAKAEGKVLWSRGGLQPGREGNFTLELPLRLLPAGAYRIRLYGSTGSGEPPAAEYALRILPR